MESTSFFNIAAEKLSNIDIELEKLNEAHHTLPQRLIRIGQHLEGCDNGLFQHNIHLEEITSQLRQLVYVLDKIEKKMPKQKN